MRREFWLILLVSILMTGNANAGGLHYTFETVDVPGANVTVLQGINNLGQTIGGYYDGVVHVNGILYTQGFLRSPDGTITTVDVPGAIETNPMGINDSGVMAIYYVGSDGKGYSALRSPDGTLAPIDVTGQGYTQVFGVNNLGESFGTFITLSTHVGFIQSSSGETTMLQLSPNNVTSISGVNSSSQIVGSYLGPETPKGESYNGFLTSSNGSVTTIDYPGASSTTISGINDQGMISGTYVEGESHGFVRSPDGVFTSVDVPGASQTFVQGINDAGDIVGYYDDSQGNAHGFIGFAVPEPPAFVMACLSSIIGLAQWWRLRLGRPESRSRRT